MGIFQREDASIQGTDALPFMMNEKELAKKLIPMLKKLKEKVSRLRESVDDDAHDMNEPDCEGATGSGEEEPSGASEGEAAVPGLQLCAGEAGPGVLPMDLGAASLWDQPAAQRVAAGDGVA
jgi:hypothetical protein